MQPYDERGLSWLPKTQDAKVPGRPNVPGLSQNLPKDRWSALDVKPLRPPIPPGGATFERVPPAAAAAPVVPRSAAPASTLSPSHPFARFASQQRTEHLDAQPSAPVSALPTLSMAAPTEAQRNGLGFLPQQAAPAVQPPQAAPSAPAGLAASGYPQAGIAGITDQRGLNRTLQMLADTVRGNPDAAPAAEAAAFRMLNGTLNADKATFNRGIKTRETDLTEGKLMVDAGRLQHDRQKLVDDRAVARADRNIKLDKEYRDIARAEFNGDEEEANSFINMVSSSRAALQRQLLEAKAAGQPVNEAVLKDLQENQLPAQDALRQYLSAYKTHGVFDEANSSPFKQALGGMVTGAAAGGTAGLLGAGIGAIPGAVVGGIAGGLGGGLSGYMNTPRGFSKGDLNQFLFDPQGNALSPRRFSDKSGGEFYGFGEGLSIPAEVMDSAATRIGTVQPLAGAPWNKRPGAAVDRRILGVKP